MNCALLVLTITVGAPALKEAAPRDPPLVGKWQEVGKNADGLEYEFTPKGEWIITRHGMVIDEKPRTYKLVPEAGKQAVDLDEGPAPYPGVFQAGDGALTLWFRYSGKGRPTGEEEGGAGVMKLTFRRMTVEK